MAELFAREGAEGEGVLLAELFDEKSTLGGTDDKMGDETEDEWPEGWTPLEGIECKDKAAAAIVSGPDQEQAGGGLSTTEGVSATPGIYANQSLSASSSEIARDWEMNMEVPVGNPGDAAGEASGETPDHTEELESARLRFRRCWAEPTYEAWRFLEACMATMNTEEGRPFNIAFRGGWETDAVNFCVDMSKQKYYFDSECDLVNVRVQETVLIDGLHVVQEIQPDVTYRVEHVVRAARIRMRLQMMDMPLWYRRRACLDLPDCHQMAADVERLEMICSCEVVEDGISYDGRAQWYIRLDDPDHYDDALVPFWTNFPKYINAVTEYQYVHYWLAKFLKPEETHFRGFTFWWQMLKQGNRRPDLGQYEVCFDDMTQTRWKGRRADAPRRIFRVLVKA